MALGSTHPLTQMSTKSIFWGKGGRYIGLTTLPPPYAVVMKSGKLNFLETSGPLQALPFTFNMMLKLWQSLPEMREGTETRIICECLRY